MALNPIKTGSKPYWRKKNMYNIVFSKNNKYILTSLFCWPMNSQVNPLGVPTNVIKVFVPVSFADSADENDGIDGVRI